MGGAIAIRLSASGRVENLAGLVVIDVVEGTALAALDHMQSVLDRRQREFASVEDAIEWSLQSGTLHNRESARFSIPSQLKRRDDGVYVWRTNLASSEKYWRGLTCFYLRTTCY